MLLPGRWERPLAWAPSVPTPLASALLRRLNTRTARADASREMDVCARCGGPLSAELEWCPRCLAPVERAPVSPLVSARLPKHEPAPEPVYSRWKAGPTSFGAAGRITLTLLVLLGSVVGYPMSRGGIFAAVGMDVPGTPFLIAYAVVAGLTAIYLIARIWKRSRIA